MIVHYKHLAISGSAGEPTRQEIQSIEQRLGATLPPDFVEFLGVANGGHTEYAINVPQPDGEPIGLSQIYSTKPNPRRGPNYGTFLSEIASARTLGVVPPQALPFAEDGGGSRFYLDLSLRGQGRIVVFLHGLPAWTGRPSQDAYIQVADSFAEFADLLYIDLDYARVLVEDAFSSPRNEEYIAYVTTILDSGLPGWREKLDVGLDGFVDLAP